jgi:hypothetical protein
VVGTVLVVVALVTPSGDRARVVVAIGLTVFFAAYEVVGTWRYGATPGRRALGIAIVTTDEGRGGLGRSRAEVIQVAV